MEATYRVTVRGFIAGCLVVLSAIFPVVVYLIRPATPLYAYLSFSGWPLFLLFLVLLTNRIEPVR